MWLMISFSTWKTRKTHKTQNKAASKWILNNHKHDFGDFKKLINEPDQLINESIFKNH